MSKRPKRWPIWKIAVSTVACLLVSPALFWASMYLDKTTEEQSTGPAGPTSMLTPSSFIMMLGTAAAMLGVLGAVWMAYRIRDARIPVWKKQGKKRR